ncbi:hypothetical protein TI03_01900, partial [Achromatium sp. WMS1]
PFFSKKNNITKLEKSLVMAWSSRGHNEINSVLEAWRAVIADLKELHTNKIQPNSDIALTIAIIQRHVESNLDLLNQQSKPANFPFLLDKTVDLVQEGCAMLEESLQLDPDYIPSYVRLIAHYRSQKQLKHARRILNIALERWPDESSVLMEAIDTSMDSNAFKKVTTYAKKLLAIDPINKRVQDILIEAHLAHFRKQVRNGSLKLALKELDVAQSYVKKVHNTTKIDIARYLLGTKIDWEDGITKLKKYFSTGAVKRVTQQLMFILEAVQLKINVKNLITLLQLSPPQQFTSQDFISFLHLLKKMAGHNNRLPAGALNYCTSVIDKAKNLPYSQQEYEFICNTLQKFTVYMPQFYPIYSSIAKTHWPNVPIIELHYFEAKYKNKLHNASKKDICTLKEAGKHAEASGDVRTARRINEIIFQTEGPELISTVPLDMLTNAFYNIDAKSIYEQHGIDGIIKAIKSNSDDVGSILEEMERVVGKELIKNMLNMMVKEFIAATENNDEYL